MSLMHLAYEQVRHTKYLPLTLYITKIIPVKYSKILKVNKNSENIKVIINGPQIGVLQIQANTF